MSVGGRTIGTWRFATDQTPWTQATFVVPATSVTGPDLTVTLGPRQALLAPFPDYTSYGYWASQ